MDFLSIPAPLSEKYHRIVFPRLSKCSKMLGINVCGNSANFTASVEKHENAEKLTNSNLHFQMTTLPIKP